ncbi:hypothetical protein DSOUD_3033 [Desulfuromonas soudanensis]|uniref:DUF1207 domain-containing protein n=1 Tax=Desulfuromonas soudanensis TaxID=1603606 RepID=A0A0M3QGC9_9BACT|nr:DUF1207 domain-containing protein [Desulfuromonas soudanensis]ALC17759.1 hypothetical protein DSOUD_3033 [Desulfuromonas soudanensis]
MQKFISFLILAMLLPLITGFSDTEPEKTEQVADRSATLFPVDPLFVNSLSSAKEPRTHVTWLRLNLPVSSFNVGSVGFGDSFGLVRVPGWGETDSWQLGISGTVLAQFNMDSESLDLINADYIIGFPLGYRNGAWSARARLFHQSSHLGDEFLLLPQDPALQEPRINLSFETIELLAGWDWKGIRVTAGPSYIVHTSTPLKRYSAQGGIDYLLTKPVYKSTVYPFASVLWHFWEETDWDTDTTVKAGLNIRSPYAEKRSIQIFGEYYEGNLPFGQFYALRAEYYGAGINISF